MLKRVLKRELKRNNKRELKIELKRELMSMRKGSRKKQRALRRAFKGQSLKKSEPCPVGACLNIDFKMSKILTTSSSQKMDYRDLRPMKIHQSFFHTWDFLHRLCPLGTQQGPSHSLASSSSEYKMSSGC